MFGMYLMKKLGASYMECSPKKKNEKVGMYLMEELGASYIDCSMRFR
jgi:hypothetical protein